MGKEIIFWGQVEDERLTYREMDDAIESILDGVDCIDDLPETIEVCGFARLKLPKIESEATHVLGHILEGLDEEHGNPEGSYTEVTNRMKKAAIEFVTVILDEYTSWACEIVKTEQINVKAWIKENRQDWLEDKDNE